MKHLLSPLGKRGRASRANARGGKLLDAGKQREAIATYQRAMAIDPDWSLPFYNLGLLHKGERQWQPLLEATLRATELDPEHQPSWWNLGIAATALGRWELARKAWRGAGIELPDGEGPPESPTGFNSIRLDAEGEGETVWACAVDPARARISSIPFGNYCYGDIVLHDGPPVGYRKRDGQDVPVFSCLALLEPSALATWCVDIVLDERGRPSGEPSAFDLLVALAVERGLAAENWTTSTVTLCKACTDGTPHQHRSEVERQASRPEHIAIAARTKGQVHDLLSDWNAEARGARVGEVEMEFSHA